jgi:hypothetical protein
MFKDKRIPFLFLFRIYLKKKTLSSHYTTQYSGGGNGVDAILGDREIPLLLVGCFNAVVVDAGASPTQQPSALLHGTKSVFLTCGSVYTLSSGVFSFSFHFSLKRNALKLTV